MTESMNPTVEIWTGVQRAATSVSQGTALPTAALRRLAGDHRYGPGTSPSFPISIAKPVSGLLPVSRQVLTS